MKKLYVIVAGFTLGLAGCSGVPSDEFMKKHFKQHILSEYAGRADVTDFKKTSAAEGVFFGVKSYETEYTYELACNSDVQIRELEMISTDDVRRLEDFLSGQTGEWDKINFAPFSNLQINSGAREALFKAYTAKKSLFFCRLGDRVPGTGRTRFLLREHGWEADRVSVRR